VTSKSTRGSLKRLILARLRLIVDDDARRALNELEARVRCPRCGGVLGEVQSYSHWSGFTHPAYDECRKCGWRSDTDRQEEGE